VTVFDAQGLAHYEFIPEGCTVNIASGLQWEGNIQKNRDETAGFLRTIEHLHINHWWSKSTLPRKMWGLWNIAIFSGLVTAQLHPVSAYKKSFERIMILKCRGSHCKNWHWYRKMIFRNAPKSYTNITKGYCWPMELLCGKCCVNRCKVTYFYIINRFQKLSEASSI
jgi:hypothetical protein